MVNDNWVEMVQKHLISKMEHVVQRNLNTIPSDPIDGLYTADRIDQIENWTNGFWGGILWQMNRWTENATYCEQAKWVESKQDAIFLMNDGFDHDSGFKWLPTAVTDFQLTGNVSSRNRGLLAATNLAGRFNPVGNFLRAWNDREDGTDTRGWVIIDSMMNLPLLYWASATSGDPRYFQVAIRHADTVQQNFIRENGSVNHIVEFDPITGALVATHGGQGAFDGSSWTRGQAWGIYGFTLSYQWTKNISYLESAKKIAAYFIEHLNQNFRVPADFAQPQTVDYEDDAAAAVTACALIELSKYDDEYSSQYLAVANGLLHYLNDCDADWRDEKDILLQRGTGAYHELRHNYPIQYADFYFMLAIAKLTGTSLPIW